MQEEALRLLIRDAIARHLVPDGRDGSPSRPSPQPGGPCTQDTMSWKTHLSHGRFVYLAPTEPDAPCVVEPQVRCHHCGFCQSYGH